MSAFPIISIMIQWNKTVSYKKEILIYIHYLFPFSLNSKTMLLGYHYIFNAGKLKLGKVSSSFQGTHKITTNNSTRKFCIYVSRLYFVGPHTLTPGKSVLHEVNILLVKEEELIQNNSQ